MRKILSIVIFVIIVAILAITYYSKFPVHPVTDSSQKCQRQYLCPDCNLILITVDSLRADHMSAFGYTRLTTPNIDSLQSKGLYFANYFTTSFLTSISQMSLLTGMYPSSTGYIKYQSKLPKRFMTLAEILKNRKYFTSALHSSPEYISDSFKGAENFKRGFDRYQELEFRKLSPYNINKIENELTSLKKSKNEFFFWLSVGSIHWPYGFMMPDLFTNPGYKGAYKNAIIDMYSSSYIYHDVLYPLESSSIVTRSRILQKNGKTEIVPDKKFSNQEIKLKPDDIQYIIDMYDNGIFYFDSFIGRLYQFLKSKGLADNSIIVIASEHGEDMSEHGYVSHYDIYDTTIKTPLIVLLPKKMPGKYVANLTSSVDVLPTLLSLLNYSPPLQTQGKDMIPYICGAKQEEVNNAVFTERTSLFEDLITMPKLLEPYKTTIESFSDKDIDIAIRDLHWKYILRRSTPILMEASWYKVLTGKSIDFPEEELYDIVNDPMEQVNLAAKRPEVVQELKTQLLNWWSRIYLDKNQLQENQRIQEYF